MTARERDHMARLDRALTIAADMFAADGYFAPNGDGGPEAIKRFLLRKASEELKRLQKSPGRCEARPEPVGADMGSSAPPV